MKKVKNKTKIIAKHILIVGVLITLVGLVYQTHNLRLKLVNQNEEIGILSQRLETTDKKTIERLSSAIDTYDENVLIANKNTDVVNKNTENIDTHQKRLDNFSKVFNIIETIDDRVTTIENYLMSN